MRLNYQGNAQKLAWFRRLCLFKALRGLFWAAQWNHSTSLLQDTGTRGSQQERTPLSHVPISLYFKMLVLPPWKNLTCSEEKTLGFPFFLFTQAPWARTLLDSLPPSLLRLLLYMTSVLQFVPLSIRKHCGLTQEIILRKFC